MYTVSLYTNNSSVDLKHFLECNNHPTRKAGATPYVNLAQLYDPAPEVAT